MTMQQQALPLTGMSPQDTGHYRGDHLLVAQMVERGSKVLDVGCGDGDLLQLLESLGIDGRGIELSREGVNRCVAKGLAVVQGDADTDLINYPDDAFDYVILSQTLQATRQPRVVLENLLRIGRRAIVSFPNFGFWKMRLQLLIGGHMPRTENLPATWYDTPNIHFCTALRRDQRQDGARRRARSLRPSAAAQRALVVLEHVRRAGRVLAEPGGKDEVASIVIPGWSEGPDLRCAIAHRGISRFRVRAYARPGMTARFESSSILDPVPASVRPRSGR